MEFVDKSFVGPGRAENASPDPHRYDQTGKHVPVTFDHWYIRLWLLALEFLFTGFAFWTLHRHEQNEGHYETPGEAAGL